MKKLNINLILGLTFIFSIIPFTSEAMGRLYLVNGMHSQYGAYEGKVWMENGEIQRNVKFKNYKINNQEIETVWSGRIDTTFRANFQLEMSKVLTSFEGFKASEEDLNNPITITLPLSSALVMNQHINVGREGSMDETWQLKGETAIPLWSREYRLLEASGDYRTLYVKVGEKIGLNKVEEWYRERPEMDKWRDHEEFKQNKQYVIRDRSDALFYQYNPNVLRIANQWINPLSIAETQSRRNAFAYTIEEKEKKFTEQMQKWNINQAGLLENGVSDDQGKKIGFRDNNDAGLWTGVFVWSQYLKYKVTNDKGALALFKKSVDGIATLVDITNEPGEFARTLQVSSASDPLPDNWVQGTGEYAHLKWKRGGNNDMIKGVFLALILAKDILDPENDQDLINKIKRVVNRLPDLKPSKKKGDSYGLSHGLKALWLHDKKEIEIFTKVTDGLRKNLEIAVGADTGFYVDGISDWSGGHLTTVSKVDVIYLAQALVQEFDQELSGDEKKEIQAGMDNALNSLSKMPLMYGHLRQPFINAATYLLVPKMRGNTKMAERLQEDLWGLREFPYPRNIGNAYADLTMHGRWWSMSASPALPWKAIKLPFVLKDDLNFDFYAQGSYSLPYYLGPVWGTDYLWKDNPFWKTYHSEKNIVNLSADYLILYWMMKAANL